MSNYATVANPNIQDSFWTPIGTTANVVARAEFEHEANLAMRNPVVVRGVSYVRYRVLSLLFSCFALSVGLIDIVQFVFKNTYFIHPSFDLLLLVIGASLLLTTLLAIKGK